MAHMQTELASGVKRRVNHESSLRDVDLARMVLLRQELWTADRQIPPGQECSNGSLILFAAVSWRAFSQRKNMEYTGAVSVGERVTSLRALPLLWAIVIASIAGEAPVRPRSHGGSVPREDRTSQKASRAECHMQVAFAASQRAAARICFSKTAKIPTRSMSRLRRSIIQHRSRRKKPSSSKINCPGL